MDFNSEFIDKYNAIGLINSASPGEIREAIMEGEYKSVPEGLSFSSTFDTYILGYCPDTLSWFATNQRFFYYEYPKEFKTKEEAEDFFRKNSDEFYKIENDIVEHRPSFADGFIYLEISSKDDEKIAIHKSDI